MTTPTDMKILSIDLVDKLPNGNVTYEEKGMIGFNAFKPSDDATDMKNYICSKRRTISHFIGGYRSTLKDIVTIMRNSGTEEKIINRTARKFDRMGQLITFALKILKKSLTEKLCPNVQTVYVCTKFPFSKDAIFKVEIEGPITLGSLMFACAHVYQEKYKLHEVSQVSTSDGKTGADITGKFGTCCLNITELVYTGKMNYCFAENYIVVNFPVCRFLENEKLGPILGPIWREVIFS